MLSVFFLYSFSGAGETRATRWFVNSLMFFFVDLFLVFGLYIFNFTYIKVTHPVVSPSLLVLGFFVGVCFFCSFFIYHYFLFSPLFFVFFLFFCIFSQSLSFFFALLCLCALYALPPGWMYGAEPQTWPTLLSLSPCFGFLGWGQHLGPLPPPTSLRRPRKFGPEKEVGHETQSAFVLCCKGEKRSVVLIVVLGWVGGIFHGFCA